MSLVHNVNPVSPTMREIEILTLLEKGLSQTKVAKKLFLSPRTIETYLRLLRKKYGCDSTSQLVGKAVRLNWIE